jgi:hypothetical protein
MLLLSADAVVAGGWGDFVAASDSSLDPAIIAAFETVDFDTRLSICQAMGRRPDPAAESLILHLIRVTTKGERHQAEHLLRTLLDSLFSLEGGPEALQQRYAANREALLEVEARWDTFADPQLRAILLRILPLFDEGQARPILMAAGSALISGLEQAEGLLPPGETALLLDFLATVEIIRGPDFLEPCLSIIRLSREKPVIDRARRVSAAVRTGMGSPSRVSR